MTLNRLAAGFGDHIAEEENAHREHFPIKWTPVDRRKCDNEPGSVFKRSGHRFT